MCVCVRQGNEHYPTRTKKKRNIMSLNVVPCYQLAVGRNDIFSTNYLYVAVPDNVPPAQMSSMFVRAEAPMPTPRFTGNVLALEKLFERLNATSNPSAIVVETQDMNIVHAFNLEGYESLQVDADDEDLTRLFRMKKSNERLLQYVTVRRMTPFSRLNIERHTGKQRLDAIYNQSFVMYPSPEEGCEDAFEVRFASPESEYISYERFLDWGATELDMYIQRKVTMHDTSSLSVEALASNDVMTFWAFILRYDQYFATLAKVSNDSTWIHEFKLAVQNACKIGVGEADSDGIIHSDRSIMKFTKLLTELTPDNRQEHAETAFLTACSIVMQMGKEKAGSKVSVKMTLEASEEMKHSKVGRMLASCTEGNRHSQQSPTNNDNTPPQGHSNSNATSDDGDQGDGAKEVLLVGQCKLCTWCGKREKIPGLLKKCGRCKVAIYCDRQCQTNDWINDHKQTCRQDPNQRPDEHAVRCVVFPGDRAVKPYDKWVRGRTFEEHVEDIGRRFLKCDKRSLKITNATLGINTNSNDEKEIIMIHNANCGHGVRANERACTVAESAKISFFQITHIAIGHRAKIRGDAIVLHRHLTTHQLFDFAMNDYTSRWGIFSCMAAAGRERDDGNLREMGDTAIAYAVPISTDEQQLSSITKALLGS